MNPRINDLILTHNFLRRLGQPIPMDVFVRKSTRNLASLAVSANPMVKCGYESGMNDWGLFLSLRADLSVSRPTTGRDDRLHDGSPCNVNGGTAISVIGMPTVDTEETGLTRAVLFGTVSTRATGPRRVAWVNRMQWYTCQSSLIREKEPELPE